jgi:UV DNA damage endonuclease
MAISERSGVPIVWDLLHHRCHDPDGIPDAEALRLAFGTWPEGTTPKIHYSSPRLDVEERKRKVGRRVERRPALPQLRAHADLVDPIGFEYFLRDAARAGVGDFDVMVEAKAKDLAVLRLREQLGSRGFRIDGGRVALDL